MRGPTPNQRVLLRAVVAHLDTEGRPPPVVSLVGMAGTRDAEAVMSQLRWMRRQGLVDWRAGGIGIRTLQVTPAGRRVVAEVAL